jgi:hypothetical protein
LNVVPDNEEHIIHIVDENCARFAGILDTVKATEDTTAMLDQINTDLEATIFPELRVITNMPDADTDEMHNVCNYIFWAKANYLELQFELTEEQMNQCNVSYHRKVYQKFDATYEEVYMPTFEYLETLVEFS